MKKKSAQKQRRMLTWLRYVLPAVFLYISAATSYGQTTYPAPQNFSKPNPEPAAPGDAFTPSIAGNPAANTPEIAEWTRTAGPNESIVLTGVNLSRFTGADEARDSRFLVYGRNGVTRDARIQRIDNDKAVLTLPKDIPAWSMYLIWPGNEAGYGKPIAVNKTDAWWVGPDKVTRGATASVFGRNLAQNNDTLRSYVYLKSPGGSGQWASVTRVNPYRVDFTVPAGLSNGTYEVWAHNGHGGQYGWSGPLSLTIDDPMQWTATTFNVKNYGAVGNGYNNDTDAIRRAIAAARNSPGATVYFPAGTYMVSNYLQIFSNMKWKGDGKDRTNIKCASNFYSEFGLLFGTADNISVNDMTFDTNNNFRGNRDKPVLLRGCTDVEFNNIRLNCKGYNIADFHNSYRVFLNNSDHTGISTFLGNCSQLFIDRNNFYMTNDSDMALHTWGGAGISLTRSTCKDLDNSNPTSGAGWGKGRFFVGNGTWGSNRMTYLAFNKTTDLTPRPSGDVDQNSGEQFLWEGNLGQWAGSISNATSTTLTVSGYTYYSTYPQYAVIIKGKGLGQSRQIIGGSGGTVTLKEPWNVIPDQSSRIVIGNFADRIAVYRNYFDGKDRASTNADHIAAAAVEPFGGAFNVIADNNTMNQLRQGIANWTTQHTTGLDPNYFNMYTNNTMTNVRWGMYNEVGRIYRPEGVAMLGVIYRNNTVNGAVLSAFYNSVKTDDPILEASVTEHNTINNAPIGLDGSTAGVANQLFYNNTFSGVGTAFNVPPKLALRENNYQGLSTLYKYPLPMTVNSVIEAPLHVIDMNGNAGGSVVKTNFTLQNSGIEPMNWTIAGSAAWLTFSEVSGTIADERGISIVELNANPGNLPIGTHKAVITVTAGDLVKKYTVELKLTTPKNEVAITAPEANATLSATQPITITANATNPNATITKVEFYAGNTKIGEDLTSPYNINWTNATSGSYALTAKSITSQGTTTSDPVNITVTTDVPPVVSITSPTANSSFGTPAGITIKANATDADGNIAKVEFFNGSTKIGESTTSPYTFTWYNVGLGTYSITAKATDNAGVTTTSAPVIINVKKSNAPTITLTAPGINETQNAPTNILLSANAEYSDGYITKVEFYNGSTKITERGHAPYESYWMNVPTGTYTITAKATNNLGVTTTSEAVRLSVIGFLVPKNAAPSVSITSPTSSSSFSAPANVTINTRASDADGSISKVEFFNGPVKIGESTTSPYSFNWTNVAAGTYTIDVRATDNAGTSTTSNAVSFTVKNASNISNAAPTVSITSPNEGNSFMTPTNITINAIAADANGTVSRVEFFNGATKLGEDLTSPYSFTWNNVAAGNYTITAKATDNSGSTTNSSPVNIKVIAPSTTVAPTVAITNPGNSASFTAPANVTISAAATDADGSVSKVEFYNGSTLLGTSTASPYNFNWNNIAAGTYNLTAKATDNSGLTATSAVVSITVNNSQPSNVAPTVNISAPSASNSFTAPATVAITANAADADGSVTKVEFYANTTKLGEDLTSPYNFTWTNAAAGTYAITAKATDNNGAITTSAPVKIIVNSTSASPAPEPNPENPVVTLTAPVANSSLVIPTNLYVAARAAANNNGTISKVEFYNGTTKIGEKTWAPYEIYLINASSGDYTITAKVFTSSGATATSVAVPISIYNQTTNRGGDAPTVSITAPAGNSSFTAPANLNISADAADLDGIAKVEFFNGATKLGEDLTAPYTYTWTNVAAGNYSLTARATDNNGLSTTSAQINVVVGTSIQACAGTGGLNWDFWAYFPPWYSMSQIPVNSPPTNSRLLTSFESPVNIADIYASRARGYICPPTSGNYVFYISGDDQAELSISTDSNPANKERIAYLTTPTGEGQYDRTSSQVSRTIYLQAGQRYYVEVLHIEGTGNDHFAVGWKLPNGTLQRPIPGANLIPFTSGASQQASRRVTDAEESFTEVANSSLTAYPNPFSTNTTIEFSSLADEDYSLAIYDMKGALVKTLKSGNAKANELIRVNWEANNLPKGVYIAKLTTKTKVQNLKVVLE